MPNGAAKPHQGRRTQHFFVVRRRFLLRYAIGVAAPLLAFAVALVLWPALERTPSPPFLAAIVVAAWVAGLGPAIVAIGISALCFVYFFTRPIHIFWTTREDFYWVATFTIVALVIAWLAASRRAGAIERIRLLRRERAARAEAEAAAMDLEARVVQQASVVRLGEQALEGVALETLMEEAITLVTATLGVESCGLLELRPDEHELVLRAGVGFQGIRSSPVTVIADTGASVIVRGRDHSFGVLSAQSRTGRTFTADDIHFLQAIANVLAMAIERKRAEAEREELLAREQQARRGAEQAQHQSEFLAEVSTVLGQSLDYRVALKSVARLALPYLADWSIVHVSEPSSSELHPLVVTHLDPATQKLGEELFSRLPLRSEASHGVPKVLRTGESEFCCDPPAWLSEWATSIADRKRMRSLGVQSVIVVPLQARGRVFGTMTFLTAESRRRYTAEDLALAQDVAGRAALAVDNARLYLEAQQANQAKDEFLATLSHELRTPLQSMLGWVRLMRSGRLDTPGMAKAMTTIERNTRAQAQLIEDLLDVSRIVAGKLRLDLRPVNLVSVIEAAVDSVRAAAEAKSIRLSSELDPGAAEVEGDPQRLEQVISNLLSNAVKFTGEGGRVEIHLERAERRARIMVVDTGSGISHELLPHIFDRFHQADSSTTRVHGGLGLGLAIVRHLVDLHEGSVHAASPGEGHGSTFTVELPLGGDGELPLDGVEGATRDEDAEPARQLNGGVARSLDRLTVLVVDDDVDTRELLAAALPQYGATIVTTGSVDDAIKAVESHRPDVVVSDISMPGDDGYALLRRLRGLDGDPIPVVAITAHARGEDRDRAISSGFVAYMAKPFDPAELARLLAGFRNRRARVSSTSVRRNTPMN